MGTEVDRRDVREVGEVEEREENTQRMKRRRRREEAVMMKRPVMRRQRRCPIWQAVSHSIADDSSRGDVAWSGTDAERDGDLAYIRVFCLMIEESIPVRFQNANSTHSTRTTMERLRLKKKMKRKTKQKIKRLKERQEKQRGIIHASTMACASCTSPPSEI